jgi:DNA repair protein RadC
MNARHAKIAALSVVLGLIAGVTSAVAATRYFSHALLLKAQNQLVDAKLLLQHATHTCGGHRDVAIQKIDAAIDELAQARAYADAHPQEDPKPYGTAAAPK